MFPTVLYHGEGCIRRDAEAELQSAGGDVDRATEALAELGYERSESDAALAILLESADAASRHNRFAVARNEPPRLLVGIGEEANRD